MNRGLIRRILLATTVLGISIWAGATQVRPANPASPASPPAPSPSLRGPVDTAEFEAFLDGFFAARMDENHIPGAVVVLVKEGRLYFQKGFGFADLARAVPVDPEKTTFRVASLSKLFTATAVLQQVEAGHLDLEADVNRYLDEFKLEAVFERPVTLHDLLTHSGGLDVRRIGLAAPSPEKRVPLGEYLNERLPPRVRPPGRIITYNNHGYALAGHIVERTAGMPFADYVRTHILDPLGMNRSHFRIEPPVRARLAKSYRYEGDEYQANPIDYLNIGPAASLVTTASDMARFMIALLQEGSYGENRVLKATTMRTMHERQFTHHPRLPGVTYGMFENYQNGERLLRLRGSWHGYQSLVALIPAHDIGLFVAYNRDDRSRMLNDLIRQFMRRYFPPGQSNGPVSIPPESAGPPASDLAGVYRLTRYSLEHWNFFGHRETVRIRAAENGHLRIQQSRYQLLTPLLYEKVPSDPVPTAQLRHSKIAFRRGENGDVRYLFNGPLAFHRLAWHETLPFRWGMLAFIVFMFFTACVVWPIVAGLNRLKLTLHPDLAKGESRTVTRWAAVLAGATAAIGLIFRFGLAAATARLDPYALFYGLPFPLRMWLLLPILILGMTAVLVIFTVLAWKNQYWGRAGRTYYTLVALAALLYNWHLISENLLRFPF